MVLYGIAIWRVQTGQGMDLVRMFYNLIPQRQRWYERQSELAEFVVDETFGVPGVGTVIAGTVKRGIITPNCNFLIGAWGVWPGFGS